MSSVLAPEPQAAALQYLAGLACLSFLTLSDHAGPSVQVP